MNNEIINSNIAISIIALLVLLSALSFRLSKQTCLPIFIHNSLWVVALILISTDLIRYSQSSVQAWFVLGLALLLFNFAGIAAQLLITNKYKRINKYRFIQIDQVAIIKWSLLRIFLMIYLFGFLVYLVSVAIRYGPFTLFIDPTSIRLPSDEGSYLDTVPLFARLILSTGPVLFMLVGSPFAIFNPPAKKWRFVILGLLALSMLLLLQRTNLFMALIWLLTSFLSYKFFQLQLSKESPKNKAVSSNISKKKSPIFIFAFSIITALLVFQGIALVLGKTGGNFPENVVNPALEKSGLISLFTYSSGGTIAFLQLQDAPENSWVGSEVDGAFKNKTHGAALALPILKVFPIAKPWPQISPYINVPFEINVYTWFEPFYRDFREIGVWVGSIILGFGIVISFGLKSRHLWLYWLQTGFLLALFFSPFVYKFYDTIFISGAILLVTLALIQQRKLKGIQN